MTRTSEAEREAEREAKKVKQKKMHNHAEESFKEYKYEGPQPRKKLESFDSSSNKLESFDS